MRISSGLKVIPEGDVELWDLESGSQRDDVNRVILERLTQLEEMPGLYHSENVDALVYLLQKEVVFPLTEESLETLGVAKKTHRLVCGEFCMNYFRFFIGAACGIVALSFSLKNISNPSLINFTGASVSGVLGLLVTRVRGVNVQAASHSKHRVISDLFEKYKNAAATLIQIHRRELHYIGTEPLAEKVAEFIRNRIQTLKDIDFSKSDFYGLNEKEVDKITSPLDQAVDYILKGNMPSEATLVLFALN